MRKEVKSNKLGFEKSRIRNIWVRKKLDSRKVGFEKIGFEKRREKLQIEQRAVQYLPGDRVVEILRLPGKGEFDYDAKKRRQREERCCCCGSKRGSVFGRHVSFCEEAFLCVAIGDSFVHFYLDLSTPRSINKNESFLRFPPANRRLQIESSWSSFLSTTI